MKKINIPSWSLVVKDMKKRNNFGVKKYKKSLDVTTKKDLLLEHYEELLDAVVYIRTELEKRKIINGY